MSTRSGYDRIDTEQSVQYVAVVAVVVLSVLIAMLYLGHQFSELILALGRLFQV
jgi:hypothetical protein